MTIETHRFRNDTATRKRLMVPESFAHPAKGQLGMWTLMVERYSQPGDLGVGAAFRGTYAPVLGEDAYYADAGA